jgi:hypothetical protein
MAVNGFSLAPQHLGSFKCLDGTYAVWASTRSEGVSATQWQFRYAPLPRPEVARSAPITAARLSRKDGASIG